MTKSGGARRRLTLMLVAALSLVAGATGGMSQGATAAGAGQTPEAAEAKRLTEQYRKLYDEGKYDEAIPLAESVLKIYEETLKDDNLVSETLNNLALIYQNKGDLVRAEQLLQRSLAVSKKGSGPDVTLLSNIAGIYYEKGDFANAERLLMEGLEFTEKKLKADDPTRALFLNNLAELYRARGEPTRAEIFLKRAVAILEKSPESNPAGLAQAYDNLGKAYIERAEDGRGESMLKRALALREKIYPNGHMELAWSFYGLAVLNDIRRNYSQAEPLYMRSIAMAEKTGGAEHPRLAEIIYNMATMFEAKGEFAKAVAWQTRANEIRERNLALFLSSGSERQKLIYINSLKDETDTTISLNVRSRPEDGPASRLGLTTVLRRKGRALDVWTNQLAALRRRLDPQDRELLDRLTAARARLSRLVLGGGGEARPAEQLLSAARLEVEIEGLENDISQRSLEFRVQAEPVTIERVQSMIPADAALVELFSYKPTNLKRKRADPLYGEPHYVAYVLRREGAPAWVELGEAANIERGVAEFRLALSAPNSAGVRQIARSLDELVMRPVRRLLGDAKRILLSPDGALNLIPFGALVDEQGKHLVEGYTITYLTSGRDLLRLDAQTEHRQQPLIIANPSFDVAVTTPAAQELPNGDGGRGSLDFNTIKVAALPGTAQEAAAIRNILPQSRLWTERAATEAALKQVAGPRILHIATHGFFLNRGRASYLSARQLVLEEAPRVTPVENPLLRSGLVLAGVTKGQSGAGEDGVLTALEAAGLDLWGTKLVVLSACETGVGDVADGDGVYGLRRSLVLAGAESQLMSLWQVSDNATRDLMIGYYQRVERGEGRGEALRAAQLAMLRGDRKENVTAGRQLVLEAQGAGAAADYTHPYYWASFIPVGDWRGISKAAEPRAEPPRQTAAVERPRQAAAMTSTAQTAKPQSKPAQPQSKPAQTARPEAATRPAPSRRAGTTPAVKPSGGANGFEAEMRAANGLIEQGKFDEAEPHLRRALALRPDDFGALTALGETKYAQGDFEGAAPFFERALAARPGDAGARVRVGDTYFRRTPPAYERALAEYRGALASDAKNEKAWQGIASAALRMGNALVTRDAVRVLASLYPSNEALPELRSGLENMRGPTASVPPKQPAAKRAGQTETAPAPASTQSERPVERPPAVSDAARAGKQASPPPTAPPVPTPVDEGARAAELSSSQPPKAQPTASAWVPLYTSFMEPEFFNPDSFERSAGVKLSSVAEASVEGSVAELVGKTKVYVGSYSAQGAGSLVGYEDLETTKIIIKTLEKYKGLEVVFTPEASDFIIYYAGVDEPDKTTGDMVAIVRGEARPDGAYAARVVWKDHNSRIFRSLSSRPTIFDVMSRHPSDNMTRHFIDALKKVRHGK